MTAGTAITEPLAKPARRALSLAARGFQRARLPILLIDAAGRVVDLNAPGYELLGLDAAGCKGRHFSALVDRLQPRLQGELLPRTGIARAHLDVDRVSASIALSTEDLRAAIAECRYDSASFGPVMLRVCELPAIDPDSGACAGSIASFEILDINDMGAFRDAVDQRLAHEVMWDVYAVSYDRVQAELPFYQEVVERHCAALAPDPIHRVLDLGAGTGMLAVRLLRLGKSVTAVDIGRAMLDRLYARSGDIYAEQLTVIEDTAERLPDLPNGHFDGVNVLLAFFDMQDPTAALREALRLLRPGGTLVVTEPRACFDVNHLMRHAEESLRALGAFDRLAADWARIQVVAPLIRDRIQRGQRLYAETIHELLEKSQFGNILFHDSHKGNCATISGIKP